MRYGVVTFDSGARVGIEIPETTQESMTGMMGRAEVPGGTGMLFTGAGPMWMSSTFIPLDMIALGSDGTVLAVERAEPMTLARHGPWSGATHVLEVAGGWARAHGVHVGSRALIQS